jgi:hypothetical protein
MKARNIFLWAVIFIFAYVIHIHADENPAINEVEYQETADYKFITLNLHGLSEDITGGKVDFYNPGGGGFLIGGERANYTGDETTQYNIMHYKFSNMADYGSDTFIRVLVRGKGD